MRSLRGVRAYGLATASVAVAMLISATVPALRDRTPFLMVLGAVIVSASYGGLGPGLFATLAGGIATDYLLVPPIYQAVGNPGDVERLLVLVVIGVLTSLMSAEIKKGVAQRDELLRAAEAANRAKDEFLAMVSHELRSPLSAIRMWAGVLQTGKVDAAKVAQGLEAIEQSAAVQGRLIADLLDLSRFVSGKFSIDHELVDVAAAVRASVDACRTAAADKHVELEEEIAPVGFVWGDGARIRQIVSNLVSNAVKFTPARGRVRVGLGARGDDARLVVEDTGEGIAPEALPHVFERFRQEDASTTRRHGGLGLGLAIARHLVEAHGGTIAAQSAGKGRGTTVVVTLPLVEGLTHARGAADTLADGDGDPHALDGIAVLVVDDDARAREAVAAALERSGARVRSAASARAALAALAESPAQVLVTDIAMPEEDGYGLLTRVRNAGLDVRAAALTGLAAEEDRRRGLAAGFEAYLTKPVSTPQLVRTIARLASGARG